jgi:hypothetical protein
MNIGKGLQEISVLGVDGYVQAIASFGFQNTQQRSAILSLKFMESYDCAM